MWCEYEAQLAEKLKDVQAERRAQAEAERMQQQRELRVLKAKCEQQRIEEAAKWQKKLYQQKVDLERAHKIQLAEATRKLRQINQLVSNQPNQHPQFQQHAAQEQKTTSKPEISKQEQPLKLKKINREQLHQTDQTRLQHEQLTRKQVSASTLILVQLRFLILFQQGYVWLLDCLFLSMQDRPGGKVRPSATLGSRSSPPPVKKPSFLTQMLVCKCKVLVKLFSRS